MPRRAHRPRLPLLLVAIALLVGCTPPSPATVDVDGRVADFGVLSTAGIVVQAQGQTTVTDGEGRFALAGLTTPYDLVLSRTGGSPWLHAYEGLTTSTPVLDPQRSESVAGTAPATEVNGTIVGGPLPAGRRTIVCAEGLDVVAFGCTRVEPFEDGYVLGVTWLRPGPALVRLHALRMVVGADGVPTAYEGYTTLNLSLTDGVPSTAPLALDPLPATTSVEVDVRVPTGVLVASGYLLARVSGGAVLTVAAVSLTGPFTMPVPDLPIGGVTLLAAAVSPSGHAIAWAQAAAADLPALDLPVAPQPLLPADGATGVTTATTFGAATVAGEVVTYAWVVSGGPRIALTTTRTEVTLPDLAATGVTLVPGASVTWTLYGHGPVGVDEAVGSGLVSTFEFSVFGGLYVDMPPSGTLATGPTRSLTLAP